MPRFQPAVSDRIVLGLFLAAAVGATAVYMVVGPTWQPGAPPQAHWCKDGETPAYHFGFAELAVHLGAVMGDPTECEHGDDWTSNTSQVTTTGVAVYQWCTNTPIFTREQDHWALTPGGIQHWSGDAGPPRPPSMVRAPDFRAPCAT
jgi:hypothetical protein